MRVILVYDIETVQSGDQSRLAKVKKIARKYLFHVQKSVFEGRLTEGQFLKLKKELSSVIDKNRDNVIFFKFQDYVSIEKEFLGKVNEYDSRFL
jgi:CRISPR-associated protein Cas2